jgi:hypothetical protein
MITLNQHDKVVYAEEYKVFQGGDYEDTDLVLVYKDDESVPTLQFQAYYIKNGVDYPTPSALNSNFKINNSKDDPSMIDYDILGFQKKRTLIKGELVSTEYYNQYDAVSKQYLDLVVSENREYYRNESGIVEYRKQLSLWYLNDGSVGMKKEFIKYYSPDESISEGVTRRQNMISGAKLYALATLGQNYAFDLLMSVKPYVDLYYEGYAPPLINAISGSTKPYLNETIKTNIVDLLSF